MDPGSKFYSCRILPTLRSPRGYSGSDSSQNGCLKTWRETQSGQSGSIHWGKVMGLSFHRLTLPQGLACEEAADGLHSVQETMGALMCQTKRRREKTGRGDGRGSEDSPFFWVRGTLKSHSPKKQDHSLSPEMPAQATHLCLDILRQTMTTLCPN